MKRYEAYNIHTQETIATADTITALADMIYITRQTVSKAVQQNLLREYSPKVFAGGIVVRDTWTTERSKPLKKPKKDDNTLYHIYKASTGEYITALTLSELYNKLKLNRIGALYTAIDNHPIYKHNITITREKHPEPYFLPGARKVYEMFDSKLNLVVSTFRPELVKWWEKPDWTPNPYKINHYMAKLPENYPAPATAIDYNIDIDLLLDNDN